VQESFGEQAAKDEGRASELSVNVTFALGIDDRIISAAHPA
jgi:hypothetical protein